MRNCALATVESFFTGDIQHSDGLSADENQELPVKKLRTDSNEQFDLWHSLDSLASSATSSRKDSPPSPSTWELELQKYIALEQPPSDPKKTNVFTWWTGHEAEFPFLQKLAKRFLSCPPTSAASEQMFSSVGQIYTDYRSRLLATNAEKLVFLKKNLPLINYDY